MTGTGKGKGIALRVLATFVMVTVALFIRDEIIYQTLILPRVSPFRSGGLFLWICAAIPVVIAFCLIAWRMTSFKEIVPHAVTASLADHLWEYLSEALFKAPALKTSSVEEPAFFWTVGLLLSFIFWGMCIGVVYGIRELIRQSRNG